MEKPKNDDISYEKTQCDASETHLIIV
jgi:hypothetical protein